MDKEKKKGSGSSTDEENEEDKNVARDKDEDNARYCVQVINPLYSQPTSPPKRPCIRSPIQPCSSNSNKFLSFKDVEKMNITNENSDLICGIFKNFVEFEERFCKSGKLNKLQLHNCFINATENQRIQPEQTLTTISFENCDENIFKIFRKQTSLKKIAVFNADWTWNGFTRDIFNEICGNCKDLDHIVLRGPGTGNYFDSDVFPFKIKSLETTSITHHWYVEIKGERVNFLESQKGRLKELTIHELPYDFDGGRVLKFIIDEMKLETFYYGCIPLILNGQKQKVKEFTASEIQITSAFEIIRQFECDKFILKLSNTDISSGAIEKIINPPTDIFKNLKEFEVIDRSGGSFAVFLGLYKNLLGAHKIIFKTKDRNVYKILEKLQDMPQLREIQLTVSAPIASQCKTSKFATDFKFTKTADNEDEEQQENPDGNIEGPADNANAPGGNNPHQGNEEDDIHQGGGGGVADGDGNADDNNRQNAFDRYAANVIRGIIVERKGTVNYQSALFNPILHQHEEDNEYYYYIHAFGFYRVILTEDNVMQLESLLGQNLVSLMNPIRESRGKIQFKIYIDNQENRNRIHNRIMELAFIPNTKRVQLPLITLSSNLLVTICCYMNDITNRNALLTQFPGENNLDGSLWTYDDPEPVEGRGFRVTFRIDGKSFYRIQELGHPLKWKATDIEFEVQHDPYQNDITIFEQIINF